MLMSISNWIATILLELKSKESRGAMPQIVPCDRSLHAFFTAAEVSYRN